MNKFELRIFLVLFRTLYLLINKLYIYHLIDHNESFDLFLFFEKKKILVAWVGQGAWALTGSTPGLIDSCTYWNINGNDILMVWDAWQGIYYQDLDSFLVNGLIVVTKQLDNPFLLLHQ